METKFSEEASLKEQLNVLLRGASETISEKELLNKLHTKKNLRIKLGVDPTSADLHLGHTVVLNKLRQFQNFGHTVVFIIGDFTSLIGDPSGQSITRPRLTAEEIDKNAKTYQDQVFKILDPSRTEVRKNSEWLDPLGSRGILDLGFRYTLQRIIERDDFSKRIKQEKPVAFTECFYPLLQGYDSVSVKADVEIGGTDQKFNLLVGRELQKDFGQEPQVVMTMPLLVGLDGERKMSKSYKNHVALQDTPGEMFGKLMSVPDEQMWSYFELLTDADLPETKKMHPKQAKMKLGQILTTQYHSASAAEKARAEFENIFSKGDVPEVVEEFACLLKIRVSHLLFESDLPVKKKPRVSLPTTA